MFVDDISLISDRTENRKTKRTLGSVAVSKYLGREQLGEVLSAPIYGAAILFSGGVKTILSEVFVTGNNELTLCGDCYSAYLNMQDGDVMVYYPWYCCSGAIYGACDHVCMVGERPETNKFAVNVVCCAQAQPCTVSQLNGNNGEWTNGDDMPRGGKNKKQKVQQELQKAKNELVRATKQLAQKQVSKVKQHVVHKAKETVNRLAVDAEAHAHKYLHQLVCPSRNLTSLVGLPTYPTRRSQKTVQWVDFAMVTDSTGVGFIGINPCVDTNAGQYSVMTTNGTTATWSGAAVIPDFSSVDGGLTKLQCNAPYSALVSGRLQARVVSASIVINNNTSQYTNAGQVFYLAEPNHMSLNGLSFSQFQANRDTCLHELRKDKPIHFNLTPTMATEQNYTGLDHPWNNNANAVIGALVVQGASGTAPVTLLGRYTQVIEYAGQSVEAVASDNPIPAAGVYEHVLEVAHKVHEHKLSMIDAGKHLAGDALSKFGRGLLHKVRKTAGGAMQKAIDAAVGAAIM